MLQILRGMWHLSTRGWWWAAPLAYVAAWGLPEAILRLAHAPETPFARGLRVACFAAAALTLLAVARRRRVHALRFVFDPVEDRLTKLPWSDVFLGVTLAQWAWLALPLSLWALARVVA